MKLSERIKPISYVKANASEVLRSIDASTEPLIITQNGEAKAVLQGIDSYERTQETLALLAILALGKREVEAGQTVEASKVIASILNE